MLYDVIKITDVHCLSLKRSTVERNLFLKNVPSPLGPTAFPKAFKKSIVM